MGWYKNPLYSEDIGLSQFWYKDGCFSTVISKLIPKQCEESNKGKLYAQVSILKKKVSNYVHTSSALSPWGVVSSPGLGDPRSKLFLPSRTFFCFLMLLSAFPLFNRRTGLVSHFFSVLVERFGPGELWMELMDEWGCKLATDSDFPPFSLEDAE